MLYSTEISKPPLWWDEGEGGVRRGMRAIIYIVKIP